MGTEMGLADVVGSSYADWYQHAFAPSGSGEPVTADRCDDDVEFVASGADPRDGAAHLFMNAVPVPGNLHILDNCTGDVHEKAMPYWPKFLAGLRLMCSMLCRTWVRERFVGRCVRGPTADRDKRLLKHQFKGVTEWRWGTLLKVLAWLLPLRSCLQSQWDARLFLGGSTVEEVRASHAGDEGIDVEALSDVVHDPPF